MAVIKQSRITSRVIDAISSLDSKMRSLPDSTSFRASEIMGCRRMAILSRRDGVKSERTPHVDIRYAIHRMESFEVLREDVHVSDQEMNLSCTIDMIVKHMDEIVIVMTRESEGPVENPIIGDVYDIVSSMYVVGVWSGILVYSGDGHNSVFFVNPDRKDAKRIISELAERGREMFGHMMSGTVPYGESCRKCPSCAFTGSCDAYRAYSGAKENNGAGREGPQQGVRDRQEEGESAGT